jgi:FtsH-binding integral membrane protein
MAETTSLHIAKVYFTLSYGIILTAIGTTLREVWFVWPFLVGISVMMGIAFSDNNTEKLVYFSIFTLCQGVIIADVVSIVPVEVIITTMSTLFVLFSTISLSAFFAKGDFDFMMLYGILGVILNVLLFVSFANLYFQSETLFYGDVIVGLFTFSIYLFVDTVKMIYEHENGNNDFVWHAISLYLDVLNLFIRLLILIAENRDKDKKDKK